MPPRITCAADIPGKTGKHKNHIFHSNAVLIKSAAAASTFVQIVRSPINPPIPKLFRQPRQPKRGSNRPPPPIVAFLLENLWHLIYHLMNITSYIEYLMRGIFNDT